MPFDDVSSVGQKQAGTASIELIGAIPFLLLAVLAAAQVVLAGQALWSAGVAARAGARAALVGGDPATAARRALPSPLRNGATVDDDGAISVRVPVPLLLPGLPDMKVGASAALEDDDG